MKPKREINGVQPAVDKPGIDPGPLAAVQSFLRIQGFLDMETKLLITGYREMGAARFLMKLKADVDAFANEYMKEQGKGPESVVPDLAKS